MCMNDNTIDGPPCTCTWQDGARYCERHRLDDAPPERPAPPAHLLPKPGTLGDRTVACGYCNEQIFWGKTKADKRSPFNAEPPHVNHHSTCTGLAAARRGGRTRAL